MAVIITRLRSRWDGRGGLGEGRSQSRKSRPFLPYSDVTEKETSNLNLLIKPTKKEERRERRTDGSLGPSVVPEEPAPFVKSFTEAFLPSFLPSFHTAYPSVTTVEVALTRCCMKIAIVRLKPSNCLSYVLTQNNMIGGKIVMHNEHMDLFSIANLEVYHPHPSQCNWCGFDLLGRNISRFSHISTLLSTVGLSPLLF